VTDDHKAVPQPGTLHSAGAGPNTGREADARREGHYPIEAHCVTCGEIIWLECLIDHGGEWQHTGRKPGDPR